MQTLMGAVWPGSERTAIFRAAALALGGIVLLTISAKLKVPFYPVPMTMQTFVVLVIGAAYGWRLGGATVLLYLILGAFGLPVFADTPQRGLGLSYMLGPTGGYLLGFLVAAVLTGVLAERGWDRNAGWLFAAMLIGHAAILAFGAAWLAQRIGFGRAWTVGVAPFHLATLLKCALGVAVLRGAWRLHARGTLTRVLTGSCPDVRGPLS